VSQASPPVPPVRAVTLPVFLAALALASGCIRESDAPPPPPAAVDAPPPPVERPSWIASAVVAAVSVASLTPEGTLAAARARLGDLRALGLTVLWLPGVEPPFAAPAAGDLAEAAGRDTDESLRAFVDAAHARGLHVLLDCPRPIDSTLAADSLAAMLRARVARFDVDGFRCANAEARGPEVWRPVIAAVRRGKPLLLLADGTAPWLREAGFDAVVGRDAYGALHAVWEGAPVDTLYAALMREGPEDMGGYLRIIADGGGEGDLFVTAAAARAATAVAATLPGFPLLSVGTEGSVLRLPAPGASPDGAAFFPSLLGLRRSSRALREGKLEPIAVEAEGVIAYARANGAERVVVVVNARGERRRVILPGGALGAAMQDVLTATPAADTLDLEPYGVRLFRGLSPRPPA